MEFSPSGESEGGYRAECGTRTRDLRITNALLYQLSQFGVSGCKGKKKSEKSKVKRKKINESL